MIQGTVFSTLARPKHFIRALLLGSFVVVLGLYSSPSLAASNLPTSFVESLIVSGIQSPTRMEFAPDGRIFVLEQTGDVRIVQNGVLLPLPFLSVTVDSSGERGLDGLAFDPNFATNNYLYIYYTSPTPASHNRLSRFTANGNVAVPGSELILIDFPNLNAPYHNAGGMAFGPDGKLYLSIGDDWNTPSPQIPDDFRGKIFRFNTDGTAPSDNPYYNTNTSYNKGVWAMGFRNPFTITFQPGTGRLFENDVGTDYWEEINDIVKGGNYGYAIHEGYSNDPPYKSPLYAYSHTATGLSGGCAITGGTFYNPSNVLSPPAFPASYTGKYFFADYCRSYIQVFDPLHPGIVTPFADNTYPYVVALKVAPDGSLYYLARGNTITDGSIFRIAYSPNSVPSITQNPLDITVQEGTTATFTCGASGEGTLTYQWQLNSVNISGATGTSYTTPAVALSDDGGQYRCLVSNVYGTTPSTAAILSVSSQPPPTGTISITPPCTQFLLGATINFSGTATDPTDGNLPASAYTWWVDLYHQPPNLNLHTHPVLPQTSGITSGSFTIPAQSHGDGQFWYRVHLKVINSANLPFQSFADVNLDQVPPTQAPNAAPSRDFLSVQTNTLTWGRVTSAAAYELQVSRNSAFTNLLTINNPLSSTTLSYTVNQLPNGKYYWRVRALDTSNRAGNWSAVGNFTVLLPGCES